MFLQNIFSTKVQWSTQWDIPVPVSWWLLEKRLGTASGKGTLTSKTSAGYSQKLSVQKHSCLGEHLLYHHTPHTFHYTVLHPASTNRHEPGDAAWKPTTIVSHYCGWPGSLKTRWGGGGETSTVEQGSKPVSVMCFQCFGIFNVFDEVSEMFIIWVVLHLHIQLHIILLLCLL